MIAITCTALVMAVVYVHKPGILYSRNIHKNLSETVLLSLLMPFSERSRQSRAKLFILNSHFRGSLCRLGVSGRTWRTVILFFASNRNAVCRYACWEKRRMKNHFNVFLNYGSKLTKVQIRFLMVMF